MVTYWPALAQIGSLFSLGNMLMLIRASASKLSTAMARYPDDLSLRTARACFFETPDSARTAVMAIGGFASRPSRSLLFSQLAFARRAARLHDLHHIAASTERIGQAKERLRHGKSRAGCGGYHAAWLLNLGGFGAGLLVAPRRVFHAFLRGRRAKTNLYKSGIDESRLDQITVEMLRDELGLRVPVKSARSADLALFGVWCIPSILAWLPLPLVMLAVFVADRASKIPHSLKLRMIRAILFDAAGTLFYLTKTVGDHYAYVGREVGLDLDAQKLEIAFHAAWKQCHSDIQSMVRAKNDDKGWWCELVGRVLDQVAPSVNELDRDNFFEVAYEHFAEAGVWELYPEVPGVLEELAPRFRLAVISNF